MCRDCAIRLLFVRGGPSAALSTSIRRKHFVRNERTASLSCVQGQWLLGIDILVLRRSAVQESRMALVGASAELFGGGKLHC